WRCLAPDAPAGETPPPGAQCSGMEQGPASVSSLESSCFGQNASYASGIAREESHGSTIIHSGVDYCAGDGSHDSVSWGLFQINLTVHKFENYTNPISGLTETLDCPKAFNMPYRGASSRDQCKVTNRLLYQACVRAAQNPSANIRVACKISKNGSRWGQWGANNICGFPK
ncbi:MAG: hypothetical protein AAB903_03270, partial [Patescibacteria group bacterium]